MTTATARATYRPPTLRRAVQKAALYIAIIFVTAITIFPIYWMIVSTIQPNKYSLSYPPPFFPQEIAFNQFAELFSQRPIANWLKNSFVIATISMLLVTALSVLGAYTLSSLRWRGRSLFGLFLLVTQMLPEILVLAVIFSFKGFALIFLLTGGGPNYATETVILRIYNAAFRFYDYSYAAAMGVAGFVISLIIAIGFITMQARRAKELA